MDQPDSAPIVSKPLDTDMDPVQSPGVGQSPDVVDSSITNTINYLLALITFLLGILLGYFLLRSLTVTLPDANLSKTEKISSGEIGLPIDAIQIQACADRKGSLYVRSGDIPVGPVYMVNDGKIIGIEFMLAQEDFLSGKSYQDLAGLNMEVDHVNVGLLSQGHEGYTRPHYHVDVYRVSSEIVAGIKCPQLLTPTAEPTSIDSMLEASPSSPLY